MSTSEQRNNVNSALIAYQNKQYLSFQKAAAAWNVLAMTLLQWY